MAHYCFRSSHLLPLFLLSFSFLCFFLSICAYCALPFLPFLCFSFLNQLPLFFSRFRLSIFFSSFRTITISFSFLNVLHLHLQHLFVAKYIDKRNVVQIFTSCVQTRHIERNTSVNHVMQHHVVCSGKAG